MSNNAAERELRAVAVGRKNFAGSDEGGRPAAAIYTLIQTARFNDIDPQAWLADVLAHLPEHPIMRISEFLPWNWTGDRYGNAANRFSLKRSVCISAPSRDDDAKLARAPRIPNQNRLAETRPVPGLNSLREVYRSPASVPAMKRSNKHVENRYIGRQS
jgi:hypothetical protein